MSLFGELKRRNVFRAGLAYAVVAWLVAQVLQLVFESFAAPEWVMKVVLALLAAGLPLVLIFAWAFELTPEGLRREASPDADRTQSSGLNRKFNILIVVAIVAELAYFGLSHDWRGKPEQVAPGEIRSIVVLPLDNLMGDPEQGYFVEGMHDALITELSKVKALRVISRTSAMHYAGSGKSVPEIARELHVDAVVEGSVLKAGNQVRVNAQLIEARADRHLWADTFDREMGDILALHSDVTREIVDHIRIAVTPDEQAKLAAAHPVDPEVYELYLKGRYLCRKWGPQEMKESIGLLQRAIDLDPRHAPSQALLAECLVDSAFFEYMLPVEIDSRARSAALAAVELDDKLAEAHVALGAVSYYLEFDPKAAEPEYLKALELNPNSIDALLHVSWFYAETGRFDKAFGPTRLAVQLDPLSTAAINALGQVHYLSRDFDPAIEKFESALELDRADPSLNYYLASALLEKAQYESAIASFRSAVELSDGAPLYLAALGHACGVAGMRDEAENVLAELQQAAYASPYNLAIVLLGLGRYEQAIEWLEKAYEARNGHLVYVYNSPVFDPLRDEERFIDLLRRMGG